MSCYSNYHYAKKLPLRRGKSYNKIDQGRAKSSQSIECLDSCMLIHNLKEKWKTIGSPVAFAGISNIYDYYNKQISKKRNSRHTIHISNLHKI